MAAGESKRFNGIKQLAMVNGQTLLNRAIAQCQQAELNGFSVALGANFHQIYPSLATKLQSHKLTRWQQGMGSSLSEIVSLAPASATHILVVLADQIAISHITLNTLIEAAKKSANKIVCAKYEAVHGVPAIFPKTYFAELIGLSGERGARALLHKYAGESVAVALPEAATDIDTQADLQRWFDNTRSQDGRS